MESDALCNLVNELPPEFLKWLVGLMAAGLLVVAVWAIRRRLSDGGDVQFLWGAIKLRGTTQTSAASAVDPQVLARAEEKFIELSAFVDEDLRERRAAVKELTARQVDPLLLSQHREALAELKREALAEVERAEQTLVRQIEELKELLRGL